MEKEQEAIVQYGSVRFTNACIQEMQDGRPIQTINRAEIRSIHVHHGLLARHPGVQAIFGTCVAVASLCFFIPFAIMALQKHVAILPLLSVFTIALGIWMVVDSLRRGHYLEIWTDRGRQKLSLGATLEESELVALKALAETLPASTHFAG